MSDESIEKFFDYNDAYSSEQNARRTQQKEFGLPLLRKSKEIRDIVAAMAAAARPDDYDEQNEDEEEDLDLMSFIEEELEKLLGGDEEMSYLELSPKQMDIMLSQVEDHAVGLHEKTANAMRSQLYILQMESAVLAKITARDLATVAGLCIMERIGDKEHWHLLRVAIEDYRLLFREWIKSVKPIPKTFDEGDGWGLFLPDKDPNHEENREILFPLDPDENLPLWNEYDDEDEDDDEEGEEWKKI